MRSLLKWIVGISFIITGGGKLVDGSMLGVLFIVVGVFMIPPFLNYVETERNFKFPRVWKYIAVVFTFLIVVAASQKKDTESISSADTPTQDGLSRSDESIEDVPEYTSPPTPEFREYSIVSSPEKFRKGFNAFMAEVHNNSLKIKSLSIDPGEVNNIFQYMLTENIAIVGQLNKRDNSIRSILLTLQGDGTLESGLNIMTTIMAVIDATNPGLSPEERGKVLKNLGLFKDGMDVNKLKAQVIKNRIRYDIRGSEVIGLMFSVESEDEND